MCLSTVWSKEKTKEWLDKQPDEIKGWKVTSAYRKVGGGYELCPPCFKAKCPAYKKTNKRQRSANKIVAPCNKAEYQPNFHLFMTRQDARDWWNMTWGYPIIKCSIPKSQITAIGTQSGHRVIVTKEFTFVPNEKQKKYFGEQ